MVGLHRQRRATRAVVGRAARHELHDFAPWPTDRLDDTETKQGGGGEIDVLHTLAVVHHYEGIGGGIKGRQQQRIGSCLRQLAFQRGGHGRAQTERRPAGTARLGARKSTEYMRLILT